MGFALSQCIDSTKLNRQFAGRELDESFFRDLPAGVDSCGENGEFHTFVTTGRSFRRDCMNEARLWSGTDFTL